MKSNKKKGIKKKEKKEEKKIRNDLTMKLPR